jgi:hypothetical protein
VPPVSKVPSKSDPLVAAMTLLGAGLVLRTWKPEALQLPTRPDQPKLDSGYRRRARQARDAIAQGLPPNMNASLSNALLFVGGGLALLRLLDEVVEESERLF